MLTDGQVEIITTLVKFVAWPAAVFGIVVVLHEPLGRALDSMSGRVQKLSVLSVSIELAQVPEARPAWVTGPTGTTVDFRGLTEANQLNDSFAGTLMASIEDPGALDFAVIDLGRGESWLTSRLYLFALLLERLRGLRAMVFVHTVGDADRMFLGVAAPAAVRAALAHQQPWLDGAVAAATWTPINKVVDPAVVPADRPDETTGAYLDRELSGQWARNNGGNLARGWLAAVQTTVLPAVDAQQWLAMPHAATPTWEHASWLTVHDVTDGMLKRTVGRDAAVLDQPGWSDAERVRAVVAVDAPLVALLAVHPAGRFAKLIDRTALVERLATRLPAAT